MKSFIRFNRGMMRMPIHWQPWLLLLVTVNVAIPLFFVSRFEAQMVLGAMVVNIILMTLLTGLTGFSRLVGLGHYPWFPLLFFLWTRLDRIPADDFFVDLFTTALEAGELVTSIEVPVMEAGQSGAYVKHRHPASSFAVVGVAAIVKMDGDGCAEAAIGVGGVTGKPARASRAEEALVGREPSDDVIVEASGLVADALQNPIGDHYASGEFRVHLASVLTKRALVEAFGQA